MKNNFTIIVFITIIKVIVKLSPKKIWQRWFLIVLIFYEWGGVDVTKFISSLLILWTNKLECFSVAKVYKISQKFVGKDMSLPLTWGLVKIFVIIENYFILSCLSIIESETYFYFPE